jgi:hypothetical protein
MRITICSFRHIINPINVLVYKRVFRIGILTYKKRGKISIIRV